MENIILAVSDSNMLGEQKGEIWELLRELKELRRSAIQPEVKYLGNSERKQLKHIYSEYNGIKNALWSYERSCPGEGFKFITDNLIREIIDLQFSCQNMLEGPLKLSKEQIADAIQKVIEKNHVRLYDKP